MRSGGLLFAFIVGSVADAMVFERFTQRRRSSSLRNHSAYAGPLHAQATGSLAVRKLTRSCGKPNNSLWRRQHQRNTPHHPRTSSPLDKSRTLPTLSQNQPESSLCFLLFSSVGTILRVAELRDGLGPLRNRVLGQFAWEHQANGRLHLPRRQGVLLVQLAQPPGLRRDLIEGVLDLPSAGPKQNVFIVCDREDTKSAGPRP